MTFLRRAFLTAAAVVCAWPAGAQSPNTAAAIERALRYRPDGHDFLVENGTGRFNRPLYGANAGFRIEAGDRPDFGIDLPGHGGVLRLGIASGRSVRWLSDAQRVASRYRPGSMVYEIQDPALADGILTVAAVPTRDAPGLVLSVELSRGGPVEFVWTYGGATGRPLRAAAFDGARMDDLDAAWRLDSADFAGATVALGTGFEYRGPGGSPVVSGVGSAGMRIQAANPDARDNLESLIATAGNAGQMVIGRLQVTPTRPGHLLLRLGPRASLPNPDALAIAMQLAERSRQRIVGQVAVETPDPFVNAAADALAIAADALWQPPSVLQGATDRSATPAGRGLAALELLGWHDRTRQHLEHWADRQVTAEGPGIAGAGSIGSADRDLNTGYVDSLLRHLHWTGNLDVARRTWPALQRHMAWQKRLFDRDGLYEGHASSWASEGVHYAGGGSAQATALAYQQNRGAAQVARALALDPAPYEREMKWIADAMEHDLWQPAAGVWGEYREPVGQRRVHASPALWSIYQPIEAGLGNSFQNYRALRHADTQLGRIPVRGSGMPLGDWFVLPTTNWMPYEWTANNVLPAENALTALAYWRAGRADDAWRLWKGTLLDALFAGTAPGNFPGISQYDANHRETYTDFGDTVGAVARSLIEGLFGVVPDALAGQLLVQPGFPRDWIHASLRTPSLTLLYRLDGTQGDQFTIEPKFGKPMRLRLRVQARGERVAGVQVNGRPASWRAVDTAVGAPLIEIEAPQPSARYEVVIRWVGTPPPPGMPAVQAVFDRAVRVDLAPVRILELSDPASVLKQASFRDQVVSGTVNALPGMHTAFAKVQQDDLVWWMPLNFEVRPALLIVPSASQDAQTLRFRVRNNTGIPLDRRASLEVGAQKSSLNLRVPGNGDSSEITVPSTGLLPGATRVKVDLGESGVLSETILNWQIPPAPAATFRPIDLSAAFNESVTSLFARDYLPAAPTPASLHLARGGVGPWNRPGPPPALDDSGFRGAGGTVTVHGVPFSTPATGPNVAVTSLWKNHPAELSLQISGRASHAYLLLTGTTNPMQSRMDNAEAVVTYWDGTTERLALRNPSNWSPIERDYFSDEFAFQLPAARPVRVALSTARPYVPGAAPHPAGGAATLYDIPLDPGRQIFSIAIRPLSPEVLVGLMGLTLGR